MFLLCEQVLTIFLLVGEYVLIEIILFMIYKMQLTLVTGPLVLHGIFSHVNQKKVKVHKAVYINSTRVAEKRSLYHSDSRETLLPLPLPCTEIQDDHWLNLPYGDHVYV